MTGTVYLVGAGPGAADLLTLRAARLLGQADLILHDALVSDEVLALGIRARKLNVGKRANRPSTIRLPPIDPPIMLPTVLNSPSDTSEPKSR